MKTDAEIVARMKQLEKTRPSVFGNMMIIGLLQLISFLGAIGLFIFAAILLYSRTTVTENIIDRCKAVMHLSEEIAFTKTTLAFICILTGLLLLFINILTKMINRRNAFLLEFLLILDPDEK